MRGLFHFHLATYFAPIPTSGSANTMGLVLADKVHDISHIGERATLGLRARAYLYWGKYAEALADCKELLKDSPYTLYTPENYTSIWSQEGTASEQSSRQTPRPCFLSLRRSSTSQKASLFRTLATATKSLQS